MGLYKYNNLVSKVTAIFISFSHLVLGWCFGYNFATIIMVIGSNLNFFLLNFMTSPGEFYFL